MNDLERLDLQLTTIVRASEASMKNICGAVACRICGAWCKYARSPGTSVIAVMCTNGCINFTS